MKTNPLVTIITPSYNQGLFLEETIFSVINQTYKNIEYIIIDGGSKDNTVEIIKKYEKNISYWISENDNGQADAINKGFAKATGDYICWVNSDDLLYPEFIEKRLNQFREYPEVDMIYGDVDQGWGLAQKQLREGSQQSSKEMLKKCLVMVPQMSAIWKRKIVNEMGGLDTKLHVLLDWDYFFRIAQNYKIRYIPGCVAFFRQHESSKSIKHNLMWAEELENYYLNYFSKNNSHTNIKNESLINMYLYCSILSLESKDKQLFNYYKNKGKAISPILFNIKFSKHKIINFMVKIKKRIF